MKPYDWYDHEPITGGIAYYSTKNARYECWDTNRCIRAHAVLVEVFRMELLNGSYLPYLRCPVCDKLYFGEPTTAIKKEQPKPQRPPQERPKPPHQEEDKGAITLPNLFTV